MSEPRGAQPATVTAARQAVRRPRDAATLIIVDRAAAAPRILMGRRRPDQVFLPDTFVFPGGRVEAADRAFARSLTLPPVEIEGLKIAMRGRVSDVRASALALAAVRETYEETGLVVGEPSGGATAQHTGAWSAFIAEGFQPRVAKLTFFARAITPPGLPRRYDTRFFMVDASEVAHRSARTDGELLDIDWFTIDRARGLKLPSITRHVLDDLAARFDCRQDTGAHAVPFYFHRRGRCERMLLPRATCVT